MRFTKVHGLGNDYIVLDAVERPELARLPDLPDRTRVACERRTGIGADGLIVLARNADRALSMRILNADGTDGGMCGNGARCIVRLAVERGHVAPDDEGWLPLHAGDRRLRARVALDASGGVRSVAIDMGEPVLDPAHIPVDAEAAPQAGEHPAVRRVEGLTGVFVNVGNPHMVVFVEEVGQVEVGREGPRLEHHPAFPQRMNIHWARVLSPQEVRVVTWERGAGATRACGTGACAVCVAGVITGRTGRECRVRMPGGDLGVRWDDETGRVLLSGPTAIAFTGDW